MKTNTFPEHAARSGQTAVGPKAAPWRQRLPGLAAAAAVAAAAMALAQVPLVRRLGLSPLVVGILLGMAAANLLGPRFPAAWRPGVAYAGRTVLRAAIVFFGFRISAAQLVSVGPAGLAMAALMVASTFALGALLGRALGLDRDSALLVAAGSSVCGAAAVMATESVLQSEAHKSTIAVGTVVLFGTLSLFLYPLAQRAGLLGLSPTQYGIYAGASIHEVAQVVGAGAGVGAEATRVAVIVKMTRVLLLAPLLLALSAVLAVAAKRRRAGLGGQAAAGGVSFAKAVPWFALLFVAAAAANSLLRLPPALAGGIETADTALLTVAMAALGLDSQFAKFRQAGPRPVLLALLLYAWLAGGAYVLVRLLAPTV